MKASTQSKKKSNSSSRSKNYYGLNGSIKKSQNVAQGMGMTKYNKEAIDMQSNAMNHYQGGKFLRGRKYSFPFHQKEKRKHSDSTKMNGNTQIK